jgi:hypothetical protein
LCNQADPHEKQMVVVVSPRLIRVLGDGAVGWLRPGDITLGAVR